MNTENFILTNRKTYSRDDAYKHFSKYLDKNNMEILADHICQEELAPSVFSFTTQDDILFLTLGDGSEPFAAQNKVS